MKKKSLTLYDIPSGVFEQCYEYTLEEYLEFADGMNEGDRRTETFPNSSA